MTVRRMILEMPEAVRRLLGVCETGDVGSSSVRGGVLYESGDLVGLFLLCDCSPRKRQLG